MRRWRCGALQTQPVQTQPVQTPLTQSTPQTQLHQLRTLRPNLAARRFAARWQQQKIRRQSETLAVRAPHSPPPAALEL